jgi:hypothetical protein
VSAEPFSERTNPASKASAMGFIDSVDTLILGANTYAQAKDYWPYADDQGEYSEKLNNLATIRELREQSGKDIWLWGSHRVRNGVPLLRYEIKK